jgi:retinol dehydrogenase-12
MQSVSTHFCHPNTSVRVIWVSALLNLSTPQGGVQLIPSVSTTSPATSWTPKQFSGMQQHMQTKAGVYLLAQEFSRRPPPLPSGSHSPALRQNPHNVLHVAVNPGFVKTNLHRHAALPLRGIMGAVFKSPKYGAYTELYAGLAPGVKQGDFIIPWGRKGCVPEHLSASLEVGDEGLKSVSARFYEWCEEQVKPFM